MDGRAGSVMCCKKLGGGAVGALLLANVGLGNLVAPSVERYVQSVRALGSLVTAVVLSSALVLSGLAASPTPLVAQAPRVTSSGDPSVRNASIYSLAVRPQDYPDQPFVDPFEDGIVHFEADGRKRSTFLVGGAGADPAGGGTVG